MIDATEVWLRMKKCPTEILPAISVFQKERKKNKTKRKKNKLFSIITKLTQDFFLKCAIFLRYKKDLADPV